MEIPNSVKEIGDSAFYDCSGLTEVRLGSNISSIDSYAFSGCTSAATFSFAGAPPSVGSSAFSNVKSGAIGTYTAEHKAEWEAVIGADGKWNGLIMRECEPLSLMLTPESANWSSGSITLCCTDGDTSGTAHTYSLFYEDESGNLVAVEGTDAVNVSADANGNVHLTDTAFSSRLDGIKPVKYYVKDENSRVSEACETRNRYALVVGIDKYSSKTLKELEGCVSDAKGWKNAFEDWGSCRLLSPPITDADATKENILEKLNDCAKQTKPGDTFFYAHSGHGDVGVLRTYKSTKVPNSQNITVGPEDITANEFASAMKEFPKGAGVVVILDACSSGSIPFTNKRNQGILMVASPSPECRSFAESVMVAMNTSSTRLLSTTAPSDKDETPYPKISSGDEIGWLTAVDALQDSLDGVFSHECLQTAGWRYGGADYDKDGMVDFHELGRFAEYWLGRTFDQNGMTPKMFSMNILSSIRAGRVPSPGEYGTVSAPVIGTPVNGAYHVTFKWSAVAGANDYCIAWITNNFTNFCYSTTLEKKIGQFKPGTVVSAYVKAINPMDVSEHSKTATGVVEYNVAVEEQARECDWTSICPASVNPINSNGTIDYDKLDIDHDGDGMSSFHEFIAGSDPLDIQSKFMAQISMGETGEPIVEWSPDTPELRATRIYRILGKMSLMDAEWVDVTDMDKSDYRFFKVAVELDDGSGNRPPANDARANAETLTGTSGACSFSTVDATVEGDEPIVLSCEDVSASVWFKWTAPIRGRATFSTVGSDFDTVLGIYRYDTLTEVAFNDDADDSTSRCSFLTQAGQTYYVVVAGYNESGAAALSWECVEGGTPTFTIEDGVLTEVKLNGAFEVTIPGTVREIGESAFEGCEDLVSVVMSNGVKYVDAYAFCGCTGLECVTLPYGLTSIGECAFAYCYELPAVTIPECVTNVGLNAFYGCAELTSVGLPSSLTSIGEEAFAYCGQIESFTVSSNNPAYKAQDGMLLTKNGEELLHGVNGDVSIPSGVTRIGNSAFASCVGLTNVTISTSVTNIGSRAFQYCYGLTNVAFEGNAPTVGDYCFGGVGDSCTVYVKRESSGWDVTIPGTWNGLPIRYKESEE